MYDPEKLGNKIKSLRESKNITQKNLAIIANVPQSSISNLEKGKADLFLIENLDKIASFFDLSLDNLLHEHLDKYAVISKESIKSYYGCKTMKLLPTLDKLELLLFINFLKSYKRIIKDDD